MPNDARILEEGVRPLVDVEVGPAHAGAANPDQRFAGPRRGPRPINDAELSGLQALQRAHVLRHLPFCLLSKKIRSAATSQPVFYILESRSKVQMRRAGERQNP